MKDASTKQAKSRAPEAVVVDFELCKACGICIELCPQGVFDRDELARPVVARLDDCNACAFCERHCPDFAIDVLRPQGQA